MALRRKGVSTTLGVIIFVGILFTVVIPMELVKQQANQMYERKKIELGILDNERNSENLRVVAYPNSSDPNQMYVQINNRGITSVKIVRAWFNDEYHNDDITIESMGAEEIGPFSVTLENDTYYNIIVTTERGNTFRSITGSLYYADDTWYTPSLSITVYILNDQGQYRIWVKNETQGQVGYWDSGGIVHGDVLQSFEVDESGIYTVVMKKKHSGVFKELMASPTIVEITWPDGPPLVYVYGNGDELQ
jgi:hypothetical protein